MIYPYQENQLSHTDQPYFVSEYGGIWWNPGQLDDKAWGYGDAPAKRGRVHRALPRPHRGAAATTR